MSQLRTITKIQQQKKVLQRFNIFLNDTYAFSVDEDILVQFHLHKGMQLSEDVIEEITRREDIHRYYVMAIRYLSYRMRSTKEMQAYLREKDVAPKTIAEIITRLEKEKLLDDRAFAQAFVRDRVQQTSKGPRVMEKELYEKGISKEIVTEALKQYDLDQQIEKALKWAQREAKKRSKHAVRKRKNQIKYKLLQKGFMQDAVNIVMNEVTIEVDEAEESQRLEQHADKLIRRYGKKYEGYELKMKVKAALYSRGFATPLIDQYVDKIEE